MVEQIKSITGTVLCHRAIYAGLGLTYGAGCMGAETTAVYVAATAFYAILAVRG